MWYLVSVCVCVDAAQWKSSVRNYGAFFISVEPRSGFLISSSTEMRHEPEEPDSAFEATQYFFEDVTPETSLGTNPGSTVFVIYIFIL